jgi:arylsulfatase A-like enzyme
VVLYVADTLRADGIVPYGNEVVETPALDELARQGILFENVYAPSSWTRPSVASILTGILPARHGVETRFDGLTGIAELLSERFRAHGYATGAIVTNPNVAPLFGFAQGFDAFFELYERKRAGVVRSNELAVDSAEVTEQAMARIDSANRPFFLFVLATDSHWPDTPPEEFDRYGGDYQGNITGRERALSAWGVRPEDQERIRSLYLGEIAYLDSSLGRLIAHLQERGLYDETVVAFTSDHGEEFWEHGIRGHGTNLYEVGLRVPLILRGPRVRAGERITRPARSVDLFPTLLELAGLPPVAALDGRSLLDEVQGAAEHEARFRLGLDGKALSAVTRAPWKLVWDRRRDRHALFDLEAGPGEHRNVFTEHPEVAQALSSVLEAEEREVHRDRARLSETVFTTSAGMPRSVLEGLRALGYVDEAH